LGEMLRGEPILATRNITSNSLDPRFDPQLEAKKQVQLVHPQKLGEFTSGHPEWAEWTWAERLRALEQHGYATCNQLTSNALDPHFDPQLEAEKQVASMDPSKKGKFTSTFGEWDEWTWVERLRALEQADPAFDQLKKIFEIVGKPTEAQINFLTNTKPTTFYAAKGMYGEPLWKLGQKAKGWSSLIPKATPTALDLLEKLMQLKSSQRITAMDGLQHPYCKQFYQAAVESEYTALNSVSTWLKSMTHQPELSKYGDGPYPTQPRHYRDWLYREIPNINKRDDDRKRK